MMTMKKAVAAVAVAAAAAVVAAAVAAAAVAVAAVVAADLEVGQQLGLEEEGVHTQVEPKPDLEREQEQATLWL